MTATATPRTKPTTVLTGRVSDDRGPRNRPRRAGLLAFAALMIVGSAVAVAVLVNNASGTVEVLAVKVRIAQGHTISRGDLIAKDVSGIDDTFAATDPRSLIGSTAAVDLVPGQVITRQMVTRSPLPGEGQAVVGLNLSPSRVPSAGLAPGDVVAVIAVTGGDNGADPEDPDAPQVLASGALVYDVAGSATEGGGVLVTLVVEDTKAARIAAYSSAERVAVVETSISAGGS